MKLYFEPNQALWQPERYHYAAEQMMLTLFPGEKPEYPEFLSDKMEGEENAARFSACLEGDQVRISAQAVHGGSEGEGEEFFPAEELAQPMERVYHVTQHALKMAFYQAGTALLGSEPPWGALTGVRPVKLPTRAMKRGLTSEQAKEELEQEYRVSPVRAQLALDCAQASLAVDR